MRTSETLRKALDVLTTHGIARGCMKDDQGRLCSVGAIIHAANSDDEMYRANTALVKALNLNAPYSSRAYRIERFNDSHPDADVVELFRRAIVLAEINELDEVGGQTWSSI